MTDIIKNFSELYISYDLLMYFKNHDFSEFGDLTTQNLVEYQLNLNFLHEYEKLKNIVSLQSLDSIFYSITTLNTIKR